MGPWSVNSENTLRQVSKSPKGKRNAFIFLHVLSKANCAALKQIKMIIGDLLLKRYCVCVCVYARTRSFPSHEERYFYIPLTLDFWFPCSPVGKVLLFHVSLGTGEAWRRVTQAGASGLVPPLSLYLSSGTSPGKWCWLYLWSTLCVWVGAASLRLFMRSMSQTFETYELVNNML